MFPSVIPLSGTDCSRVTHPSAARMKTEAFIPARLACVKHAASVRPEPGSNSDVQSFSSTHPLSLRLAKAFGSAPRQGVFTHSKSDCFISCLLSSSLYRFQVSTASLECFVLSRSATGVIISKDPPIVNPFFQIF